MDVYEVEDRNKSCFTCQNKAMKVWMRSQAMLVCLDDGAYIPLEVSKHIGCDNHKRKTQ